MRRRRKQAQDTAFALSGWLFAELAIVLMLVALGSVAFAAPPIPCPPPPPPPESVELRTVKFAVHVDADDAATRQRFMDILRANLRPNQTPGFIMMFGVSLTEDANQGVEVARRLKGLIKSQPGLEKVDDDLGDDESKIRPYHAGLKDGAKGDVNVEVFVLTTPG